MENSLEDAPNCPSFSNYSSDGLAELAVQVAAENSKDDVDDDDFEFAVVRQGMEVLPEKFFCDGQSGPIFPVFNPISPNNEGEICQSSENKQSEPSVRVPLSQLFVEDRELDKSPSCSSSEADELGNIPAGTYCVWRPKVAEQPSPSRCKKSNSTGSASKRWKFRDFLRRSNSEGKDSFVFLTPKVREAKSSTEAPNKAQGKGPRGSASGGGPAPPSAHEVLYIQNRAMREGEKKKSYLPYRLELVGFFVNLDSPGKSHPRF